VRYQFVADHKQVFPVDAMCRSLQVARSGFYAFERAPLSPRKVEEALLVEKIRRSHGQSRLTYGSPRVTSDLREAGDRVDKNRIARLMRLHGIKARKYRKRKCTTRTDQGTRPAADLVNQRFTTGHPNRVWVSDITYIATKQGWLYLCVFMDLYSRRIVGWAMDRHLEASLVSRAFEMACKRRRPGKGLIVHSDRGNQYTSQSFRQKLRAHGARQSMGRKGNCYDNACSESFFHTLKTEEVHLNRYRTRAEARSAIFEYIEGWYNVKRRHSTLGYKAPSVFETSMHAS